MQRVEYWPPRRISTTGRRLAVLGAGQLLGDDPHDGLGELGGHEPLLFRGDHADQAFQDLGRVRIEHGGEDLVPGLGREQGEPDGRGVAEISGDDHVGVLGDRLLDPLRGRGDVRADLALGDEGLLVGIDRLDGILDRDDLAVDRLVQVVDQGREGGRLAGAGWAGHDGQAAADQGDLAEDRRQVELLERADCGRHDPQDQPRAAALAVQAAPEPPQVLERPREPRPAEHGPVEVLGDGLRRDRRRRTGGG